MPEAAGVSFTIKPFPGIRVVTIVVEGANALHCAPKVENWVVLAVCRNTWLVAVIAVVEALWVVVVAVK